jgi:hypothetical protein
MAFSRHLLARGTTVRRVTLGGFICEVRITIFSRRSNRCACGAVSAQVFAGATDVVPQIRAGRKQPEILVDLKGIKELLSVSNEATHYC